MFGFSPLFLKDTMKPSTFNGVLLLVAEGDAAQVLQAEISSLLGKQAI